MGSNFSYFIWGDSKTLWGPKKLGDNIFILSLGSKKLGSNFYFSARKKIGGPILFCGVQKNLGFNFLYFGGFKFILGSKKKLAYNFLGVVYFYLFWGPHFLGGRGPNKRDLFFLFYF